MAAGALFLLESPREKPRAPPVLCSGSYAFFGLWPLSLPCVALSLVQFHGSLLYLSRTPAMTVSLCSSESRIIPSQGLHLSQTCKAPFVRSCIPKVRRSVPEHLLKDNILPNTPPPHHRSCLWRNWKEYLLPLPGPYSHNREEH